ncbi:MAG: UDP-N-acetylglucosamine 1-carboxyvinyltransferase, partial [Sphingobacteriales bacterium]
MGTFEIHGGKKLSGEVVPQGAKNEALQILCAVLLTDEVVEISNLPNIVDVNKLIDLLKYLGVAVTQEGEGHYTFCSKNINLDFLKSEDFREKGGALRGSIMIVGPLLARFGKGYIPKPGGDKIGRRRLDTHFEGLIKLGGVFEFDAETEFYKIESKKLKGAFIHLDEASVTGTANILMAAVLAEGETVIYNAACEPYIQQLCKMLNSMGAQITGISSNMLTIQGVKSLGGCKHRLLPDMIEIGSFIGLAAMTKSELTIKDVSYDNLGIIPTVFKRLGIKLERRGDDLFIPA